MEKEYEKKKAAEQNQKTSWMGAKKESSNAPKDMNINFKKGPMTFTNSGTNNINMVPLEQSNQEKMMNRQEQEFKFLSNKEIEERKKKRDEEAKKETQ